MIRRGLLPIEDTIYKSQPLFITGPAKSLIRVKVRDTVAIDSLQLSDEFDFKNYSLKNAQLHLVTEH
jgi:hypothetical protein